MCYTVVLYASLLVTIKVGKGKTLVARTFSTHALDKDQRPGMGRSILRRPE